MKYSVGKVFDNGVVFELKGGSTSNPYEIDNLYYWIMGALTRFYDNQGLNLVLKQKPDFNNFNNFGEHELESMPVMGDNQRPANDQEISDYAGQNNPVQIKSKKVKPYLGKIGMNYFKGGKEPKRKPGFDFGARETFTHTGPETTYESITIFFDTSIFNRQGDYSGKDKSREQAWKEIKSERGLARDVFLNKLQELVGKNQIFYSYLSAGPMENALQR